MRAHARTLGVIVVAIAAMGGCGGQVGSSSGSDAATDRGAAKDASADRTADRTVDAGPPDVAPETAADARVADSGDAGGDGSPCTKGLSACGSTCVDLETDATHCGSCTNACPSGATCAAGSCHCPTGLTDCCLGYDYCEHACVDLETSDWACGRCPSGPGPICNGSQTCVSGTCQCPSGEVYCGIGFGCVSTSSPEWCGSCTKLCIKGETCEDGGCVPP
jgi:hypothetical protein